MQNRGALWVFTILLAIACLWQLSFSFFTGGLERKADGIAVAQADSLIGTLGNPAHIDRDSIKLVFENKYLRDHDDDKVYPLFGYTYKECKEREINLGLDLKGGMAVTLEVSIPELVDNLSGNSQDPAFRAALDAARHRQSSSNSDFITLFDEEFRKAAPNGSLAAIFSSQDNAAMFPRESTNSQVIAALRNQAGIALNNTERILRTRIDKFGVAQPSIQKQSISGRIQIELPGVKDKERVRKVLQSTANLEFWETFDNQDVFPAIAASNTKLSAMLHPELAKADSADKGGATYDHTLPTGTKISGNTTGVEKRLVDLLASGKAVDKENWIDFDRVTFESGSAKLDAARSMEQLTNLAEVMKAYPAVRLKIGGYTDSTGNEQANQRLSQQRAEAVVAALVGKGVATGRLEAEGYGSQHPVASNATAEGRAKNRRMALRVLATDPSAETAGKSKADSLADAALADTTAADSTKPEMTEAERLAKNPLLGRLVPNMTGDGRLGRGDVVGYCAVSDTAEVARLLRLAPPSSPNASQGLKLAWSSKPTKMFAADGNGRDFLTLHALRVPRGGKPKLDGSVIVDARQDFDMKGDAEVTMQMNAEGGQTWKLMTGENVGKQIAIVLDGCVVSSPNVMGEIPGGRSSISMGSGDRNNQLEEATDLANVLKAGALPAPARIIDETVVGPSLGGENVQRGLISFAVAMLMVMLFMVIYYNGSGWVANVALLANVFVLMGTLASLQASLTLPGIAGIVLTVGMAVDANVLINERIREELRHGKAIKSAVDLGYKHAMSAIIDANVTHFVVAVILIFFGTGPIKSFGVTLALGILTSLFTAIFISRLIISKRLENGKSMTFWHSWNKDIFAHANYQFMAKRKYFYLFSGVLIIAGFVSMFTQGFNYGVDFSGGREYVVKFDQPVEVEHVRTALEPAFTLEGVESGVRVVSYGGSNQVKVTTNYMVNSTDLATDKLVEDKLQEGLRTMNDPFRVAASRKVDPTISDDIRAHAWYAVIAALLFIFLYIAVRFRTWQFGLGALLSLAHDALVVVALYSLLYKIMPFSLEIDEHFIAAILTVIGYSINDTVVVYDRIREYLQDHKRDPWAVVFNKAINSTLGRTINTSVTVLIVLLVIFLFGADSIKGFVFAMLVGIAVGTYSSIFIASAVVVDLHKDGVPEKSPAVPVTA
ncbi:MAG: protein translocase subunit SecD [Flavobacteriales bacterium]